MRITDPTTRKQEQKTSINENENIFIIFLGYIIVENFAAFVVSTNLCNSVTGMSEAILKTI